MSHSRVPSKSPSTSDLFAGIDKPFDPNAPLIYPTVTQREIQHFSSKSIDSMIRHTGFHTLPQRMSSGRITPPLNPGSAFSSIAETGDSDDSDEAKTTAATTTVQIVETLRRNAEPLSPAIAGAATVSQSIPPASSPAPQLTSTSEGQNPSLFPPKTKASAPTGNKVAPSPNPDEKEKNKDEEKSARSGCCIIC